MRLTSYDRDMIDIHCRILHDAIFAVLDADPDIDAELAGKAASAAENAVRSVLEAEMAVDA